jgi:hypothetical protein
MAKLPGRRERERVWANSYKRCDVKRGQAVNYGFVEFEDQRDADGRVFCLHLIA